MRMQEEFRPSSCLPFNSGTAPETRDFHRLGMKSRRDRSRLLLKNSILYCINHPDCECGARCIGLPTRAAPPVAS